MARPTMKRLAARILWATHRHAGLEVLAALMGISVTGLYTLVRPLIPLHDKGDVAGVCEAIRALWEQETAGRDRNFDIEHFAALALIAERVKAFKVAPTEPEAVDVAA